MPAHQVLAEIERRGRPPPGPPPRGPGPGTPSGASGCRSARARRSCNPPGRTAAATVTLSRRHSRADSSSPFSRYGIPQQRCAGTTTSQPFFSRTATAAFPTSGADPLTAHVTKRATRLPPRDPGPRLRGPAPPLPPLEERLARPGRQEAIAVDTEGLFHQDADEAAVVHRVDDRGGRRGRGGRWHPPRPARDPGTEACRMPPPGWPDRASRASARRLPIGAAGSTGSAGCRACTRNRGPRTRRGPPPGGARPRRPPPGGRTPGRGRRRTGRGCSSGGTCGRCPPRGAAPRRRPRGRRSRERRDRRSTPPLRFRGPRHGSRTCRGCRDPSGSGRRATSRRARASRTTRRSR